MYCSHSNVLLRKGNTVHQRYHRRIKVNPLIAGQIRREESISISLILVDDKLKSSRSKAAFAHNNAYTSMMWV